MADAHDREVARLERVVAGRQAKLDALDRDVERMRYKRQCEFDLAKALLASAKARRKTAETQKAKRAAKRRAKVKAVA